MSMGLLNMALQNVGSLNQKSGMIQDRIPYTQMDEQVLVGGPMSPDMGQGQMQGPENPMGGDVPTMEDAVSLAMQYRAVPDDKKPEAWQKVVQTLETNPEFQGMLDPNAPATNEDIDSLFKGQLDRAGERAPEMELQEEEEEEPANAMPPYMADQIKTMRRELGKAQAKDYMNLQKASIEEANKEEGYSRLEATLEKHPDIFGFGAGAKYTARRVGEAIDQMTGGNIADEDKIAAYEELQSINFIFTKENMAATKGAITEKEMELFQKAAINAGDTADGTRRKISLARAISNRIQTRAKFYDFYLRKKGHLNGVETKWNTYIKKNPINDLDYGE